MPQVDKATFLPIVFWTFIIYIGGFLLLSSAPLYTFLSDLKLTTKRAAEKAIAALTSTRSFADLMLFPLISL